MQRAMKDGLFGGGFGGPRCVGRPCRISAFPCSGGFPSSGIKREWVEKAGKPYDIDNRTDVPGAPCQHRVIVMLGAGRSGACLDTGDPCDRPSVSQLLPQFAYPFATVTPSHRGLGSGVPRAVGLPVPLPPHWRTSSPVAPHPAVVHVNENHFRAQTSFASTTNRIHPHGVTRSPDRGTGQESYGQRLPQGQETRASVEHAQTLSRTVLILGDSRNPPVNSR